MAKAAVGEKVEEDWGKEEIMPYVRKGKTVYKKVDGLKKKGSSKSVGMAKKYIRALYHAEGGGRFTKRKK